MRARAWARWAMRLLGLALLAACARGQSPGPAGLGPGGAHWGPAQFGAQVNFVWQGYPRFTAAYSGPLSIPPGPEFHNSRVLTLMSRTRIKPRWNVELDLAAANGLALGNATGLAGIPNIDITRNLFPSLTPTFYLARLYAERSTSAATVRVGRLDLVDDFDQNAVLGGDHRSLLNWSTNIDAAFDYAADTSGYTDAAEYFAGGWKLAYALLPKALNGMRLNWRSSQIVVERDVVWDRLTLRGLGYVNHAPLGAYAPARMDVVSRRRWRFKPGAEVNGEARLTSAWSAGWRAGWDDDQVEEIANTECGNTGSVGASWERGANRADVAFASNGLSAAHAAYLARGGVGFLLGDGGLDYGREEIVEATWLRRRNAMVRWGPDIQHIVHPGYNRARGPIWVGGLRINLDY